MIDVEAFYTDFITNIEPTRSLVVADKAPNAVDTLRVFRATDAAVKKQPCFENGVSSYHGNEGKDNKEFLCDYTLRSSSGEIILCLESEWGKLTSAQGTLEEVVFDFTKLLCMLAPLKIMVFAYTDTENEADILKKFSELLTKRTLISPKEQFIVFSTPWHDEMHSQSMKGYYWSQGDWCSIDAPVLTCHSGQT